MEMDCKDLLISLVLKEVYLINTTVDDYHLEYVRTGLMTQLLKGSPVYPSGQVQVGMWLKTLHSAMIPQEPGHGSTHFWFMQAKLLEHSEFIVHSGLQFGGVPKKFGKHEQDGTDPTSLHWLFGPHGDGTHGLTITGSTCTGGKAKKIGAM